MKKLPVTTRLRSFYMFLCGLFLLSCLLYFLFFTTLNKPQFHFHSKIFGRQISVEEFQKAYECQRIQYELQFGELYENFKSMIDIEQETFNSLILLEEAKHRNIKVTSQEVIDYIAQFEIFFRKNKFDTNLYRNFLKQKFNTTPQIFEENIRNTLIIKKLLTAVTSSVHIDENTILDRYQKKQHQAQCSYIRIPFERTQEQINTLVTDAEIEKHYQESQADYFLPPTIQLEYIKLIFPADGGVQKEVEMKFKAKAIVEEYEKGSNFTELGNKYKFPSVETKLFSKESPPDIGLNQEQISVAFKLSKKAVSSPIELPDGYLVYRVVDRKSSHQGNLEEVKEKIRNTLAEKKIQELTFEKSRALNIKISDALKNNPENKTFSAIAQELGLKTEQTQLETLNNIFFKLNIDDTYLDQLLNLNLENPLSQPLLTQDAYVIIHVDAFEKSNEVSDAKKKEAALQDELAAEKEKIWREFTEKLIKDAHLEIIYP